jgi:hypothetical protein
MFTILEHPPNNGCMQSCIEGQHSLYGRLREKGQAISGSVPDFLRTGLEMLATAILSGCLKRMEDVMGKGISTFGWWQGDAVIGLGPRKSQGWG